VSFPLFFLPCKSAEPLIIWANPVLIFCY
jgi:hypothetical protein